MVVKRRKKVTKYRAHTTHGGGHRKKRRGAGSRGGRGNAGTGKRASQKVAGISRKLGSKGFRPRRLVSTEIAININRFTEKYVNNLVQSGKASKEGDFYTLDLKKLGYTKLLGTGTVNLKLKLKVNQWSAKAEDKIKSAGGDLISTDNISTDTISNETKSSQPEESAA
jgi:large subunit ribosomal protein L15